MYRPDFITLDEESQLAAAIARIEFATFEMRGVIARRRVAFFGRTYDNVRRTDNDVRETDNDVRETDSDVRETDNDVRRGPSGSATPPIPDFLLPLRMKVADWAGVAPDAFGMALINEYPVGAPIGWHRDAPQYGMVAGVSLLSPCVMRLRPCLPRRSAEGAKAGVSPRARRATSARRNATHEILLERRSGYLMTGEARNAYEHHVPPVAALRYSVTFRTLRA